MSKLIKVGPYLTICTDGCELSMVDAFDVDLDMGSHHLTNRRHDWFNEHFPTIAAMSQLIEEERDRLRVENEKLRKQLSQKKG